MNSSCNLSVWTFSASSASARPKTCQKILYFKENEKISIRIELCVSACGLTMKCSHFPGFFETSGIDSGIPFDQRVR